MSLNASSTGSPEVLSGPFGSLLNDLHSVSTREAFAQERFDWIRDALRAYKEEGLVDQPVLPTFAAAPRGIRGGRFTDEHLHWNQIAAQLTHEIFQRPAFGSYAPLLDTSGGDDIAWSLLTQRQERAMRIHTPQMQAQRDAGVLNALGEAFHDFDEAAGFVKAAVRAGMHNVIASFEPTKRGLPNNALDIASYDEVAERLRDLTHGKIDVAIGMNCGNADQILEILEGSRRGTFSAVYPNHAVIPHNDLGAEFRTLGDLNHERDAEQERRFQELRHLFEISDHQLSKLVTLGGELDLKYLGLCCGASPKDTAALAARLRATTPDAVPLSPLVA